MIAIIAVQKSKYKKERTQPDAPRARLPIFLCLDFRGVRNVGEEMVGGQGAYEFERGSQRGFRDIDDVLLGFVIVLLHQLELVFLDNQDPHILFLLEQSFALGVGHLFGRAVVSHERFS